MTNRSTEILNGSHGSMVLDTIFEVIFDINSLKSVSGEQVSRVYILTTHNDLNFELQYLRILYNIIYY